MLFINLDIWAENRELLNAPKSGRVLSKLPPISPPLPPISRRISPISRPLSPISPPMMYRAQISGRCNLQFAGKNPDLDQWKKEWMLTQQDEQPSYQYHYEQLDSNHLNNCIHSIKFTFPYRVLSNSGQDSILRPVLTAHGIPFIPGSSVKGIFKRLIKPETEHSLDKELISKYCGTEETPGILRFHGAYPIGDWSKQIVDIVHPQQSKQVIGNKQKEINTTARPRPVRQEKNNESTSASTLISFYKPEFVFEFSSANPDIEWPDVERILSEALTIGLGGKTSTGYGFFGKPDYANPDREAYKKALHISLEGEGVASTLLNREPEFRPNMFKAALRGHITRLLGGVCSSQEAVNQSVNSFLGDTDKEGSIKLFWESSDAPFFDRTISPITYTTQGILHIFADKRADLGDINFIAKTVQFAYVMGGFGKSWRRIAHDKFYPEYLRLPKDENGHGKPNIGCHWQLNSKWVNFKDPLNVNSEDTLRSFLDDLYLVCLNRPGSCPSSSIANWREAWHPNQVAVYSKVVDKSQAVKLFHEKSFKYTPAIDGRETKRPPTSVSHVWHRMFPIGDGKYLEIVTIFYGDLTPWAGQLNPFIQTLVSKKFQLTWGNKPN